MAIFTYNVTDYKDGYVFIPACCYGGNQFDVRFYGYPPKFTVEEAKLDMPITITNVPRLNKDGSGKIEVTSGDAATPCVGVFSKALKKGVLVFTVQEINGKNVGLSYSNGEISITWPAKREYIYSMTRMDKNLEEWIDEPAEIPVKVLEFECESILDFYGVFFKNRKIMELDCERPSNISDEEQWNTQRQKINTVNYDPIWGYNMVREQWRKALGWCGGGILDYAMMKLGGKEEWERALLGTRYIFGLQTESGFFSGNILRDGSSYGDGFGAPNTANRLMMRRVGDELYFTFKKFDLFREKNEEIPEDFVRGAEALADAIVKLYEKYGKLGQIIDYTTGDIIIGGSTAGAIVPAALARAAVFFKKEKYLSVAEQIARQYYENDLSNGYTTGGPGEILQCPDSESAFALLESFVVLYETTKAPQWLDYAKAAASFFSSWVMSYNYRFPIGSELGRLNAKSVGTVFANIQNKHSAPGICTMSGDSIYKLYKYTRDPLYLELIVDIKEAIPQFLSTSERPIFAYLNDESAEKNRIRFVDGQMSERVNTSDWESEAGVGCTGDYSCWCEVSNLLSMAELSPIMTQDGVLP